MSTNSREPQFQKGHAIGLGQVRTPEVATISVADPRGVDDTVLPAARCVEPHRVRHLLDRATLLEHTNSSTCK